MSDNAEQCEICHKTIGNLETPWVANEQVVCAFCWATSRIVDPSHTGKDSSDDPTAKHNEFASLLMIASTAAIIAGMGWLVAHSGNPAAPSFRLTTSAFFAKSLESARRTR